MTALSAQPLPSRPRRRVVPRPPTLAQLERQLRRSAAPTTELRLRATTLRSTARASAGVPASEALVSLVLVALCFVPLLVWTSGATWALIALAAALAVTTYAVWARRVVVGDDFVAVRSVLRYRVATVDHLRHLRLRPTQRGGQLCLHTDDGHCIGLRRVEVDSPAVNEALKVLAGCGSSTRDPLTCALLSLEADPERTAATYVPSAA